MKGIELTRGLVAIVDDDRYDELYEFSWHAISSSRTHYACRWTPRAADGSRTSVRMHCYLFGEKHVDHINGNGLDNRAENLRRAGAQRNMWNRAKRLDAETVSIFKGVTFDGRVFRRKPWRAVIGSGKRGRYISVGSFSSEVEAARAYDDAARDMFGVFACVNFPDGHYERCALRPHANDCRNLCTGSNEPGQKGSAYE